MAKSQKKSKIDLEKDDETPATENVTTMSELLLSQQEVADELKMSVHTFEQLLRKYPFHATGVAGKINGRWRVTKDDVWRWFYHIQRQEARHPDSRRLRPEESPELSTIKGR